MFLCVFVCLFVAHVTRTGINDACLGDYFQLWINTHFGVLVFVAAAWCVSPVLIIMEVNSLATQMIFYC